MISRKLTSAKQLGPNVISVARAVGEVVRLELKKGIYLEITVGDVESGIVRLVLAVKPPMKFVT